MLLPQTPDHRLESSSVISRGITLLEVLISMFVLMFGLLGVASLFPAGKYHSSRALGYDQAAAVGQAAFQEIQVRGLLQPSNWINSSGAQLPAGTIPPFQFDPEATAPATDMLLVRQPGFRKGEAGPGVFNSQDDLVLELPEDSTLPPFQRTPTARRMYQGDYSWMFTVAPDPANRDGLFLVSVVVFHKRNREREWSISECTAGKSYSGFRLILSGHAQATEERMKRLEKGSWVLLTYPSLNLYSWYRVEHFASNKSGTVQTRMLSVWGRDHDVPGKKVNVSFFDSVVAVYEKTMSIEDLSSGYSFNP